MLPKFSIGDLKASLPIIQGGMGIGISLSGLASAVANAGGIGVIATAGIGHEEPDFDKKPEEANHRALIKHIRRARELSDGILGVNIMVALANFADMVSTSVKEGADIIFSGAGLPLDLPKYLDGAKSPKLAPIVSSARAAQIICKKWLSRYNRVPDAIVVEGPKAGGHLGFKPDQIKDEHFSLEKILPEVIQAVRQYWKSDNEPIPVIAAGGVYDGCDIKKFLGLGASAVQMGTRFVGTHECDAAPGFKQAYLDAKEEDMALLHSPVGLPGQAIRTPFLDSMEAGNEKPTSCHYRCIRGCDHRKITFCISNALLNAKKGLVEKGLVFAGYNAHRVNKIVSVKELIESLCQEYNSCKA
ncbi:MAG: NAD(P)H-dependent flavin oxidoreductase [Desulfovibrio sp.]|uniref:NAD(P)H-dependent flavin oxidoreductase n=1 Tax=Desulfovibrio sp. 7SRBS1 TaxID=3378064 RepID=UPI003B3D2C26